jgi:hypothetical protein
MKTQNRRAHRAQPLPQLMRRLGVSEQSIRSNDGAVRCPWWHRHRNGDKKMSASIYRNLTRIHCFVCGYNYDAIRFAAAWLKANDHEAFRFVRKNEFGRPSPAFVERIAEAPHSLVLPPTRELTSGELEAIGSARQIDVEALRWASSLAILRHAVVCKEPSWLLSDSAVKVAEARTLSGDFYPAFDCLSERKAHTIRGSKKSWPVGTALLRQYTSITTIMLVEGGPDMLAAYHFLSRFGIRDVLPVAMLGAGAGSHGIDPEALRLFRGKHVRIYPHNDSAGLDGITKWLPQLYKGGCTVSRASFAGIQRPDGAPAKDLNDLTSRLPGSHEPYHDLFA